MMCPLVLDLAADRIPITVIWGHPRERLPAGLAVVLRTSALVIALEEAWPEPEGRTARYDDHVLPDFIAIELNQLWLTDITEHWTGQAFVIVAPWTDLERPTRPRQP